MAKYYDDMCSRYAKMAEDFYRQSKAYEATPNYNEYSLPEAAEPYAQHLFDLEARTRLTISAIIFEALAIEAYVNLFGVYVLGEEKFFREYEPPKGQRQTGFRYLNTIEKLKKICKEELNRPFPEQHAARIRNLFEMRDRLVHSKAKPHVIAKRAFDYDNPEKSYEEMESIAEEITFFFEGIDGHMELYKMLQEDIKQIRGADKELTIEIRDSWLFEMGDAYKEACASAYGDFNPQKEKLSSDCES